MNLGRRAWVVILGLATTVSLGTPDHGRAQSLPESLDARFGEASTAPEPAALARDFRQRAEQLEKALAAHEAEGRRLMQRAGSIGHKWPSMVPGLQRARDRAAATRRAAEESRALAARHTQLAVEALVATRE